MKKLAFIICILASGGILFSQGTEFSPEKSEFSDIGNHTIHTDIGTLIFIGYYTANYEVTLKHTPEKNILRFRTGIMYTFDTHSYGIPLCVTSLLGKNKNYFELTAGIVPRILEDYQEDAFGTGGFFYYRFSVYPLIDLGYRHEPNKENVFYRIKIGSSGLGVGIGYTF